MKFLLDMGISPAIAERLRRRGFVAEHLAELGLYRLPDPEILERARVSESILLTHDLDFAELIAASGARLPSAVIFRLRDMRSENVGLHLDRVVEQCGPALTEGAIISVGEKLLRVRSLPLEARGLSQKLSRDSAV